MASGSPPEANRGRGTSAGRSRAPRDEKIRKGARSVHLAALGWNFVTAPLVGGGLGYGLDALSGWYPWGMIAGLLLGFVSAFLDLVRGVR